MTGKKQAQQYLKVGVETIAVNLIGNEIFWFDFLCIIIGSPPALRWLLLSFDDIEIKFEIKNDRVKSSFDFALFG